MNCVITVKGNGVGGYGHTKLDRTKPLREFIVDNNVLYSAVGKHLKECDVCQIDDVLREYLRRRVQIPKFKGETAPALVKKALVFEKLAAKKGQTLTKGLINEFIWRLGIEGVRSFGNRLAVREKFQAFVLYVQNGHDVDFSGRTFVPQNLYLEQDKYLYKLAKDGLKGNISDETLEELISVAEVMLS